MRTQRNTVKKSCKGSEVFNLTSKLTSQPATVYRCWQQTCDYWVGDKGLNYISLAASASCLHQFLVTPKFCTGNVEMDPVDTAHTWIYITTKAP